MFVIVRVSDGQFVAVPGREKSYTENLLDAWVFRSRADAERQRCPDNESVVAVEELLGVREGVRP